MLKFIKELILSIIITLVLIFILSVVVSQTSVSEKIIIPVTIGIVTFSLLIGGFRSSRIKKEKGIIYGGLLGIIYMLILYLISSFSNFDFTLNLNSIIMLIVTSSKRN